MTFFETPVGGDPAFADLAVRTGLQTHWGDR